MPAPLRVLQLSDVHFGARLTGGRLGLSETLARVRESERRNAFTEALSLVTTRSLDGVLIPGDLFDDEAVTTDTLRFVLDRLGSIAPKPVFIAPGNHDPYGGTSPYNPTAPGAARGIVWPDNVVVFAHEPFRSKEWPGRPEVSVTGCGVAANVPSSDRRLSWPIDRPDADLQILLFHGSRDDDGRLEAHKATYPFSQDELRSQNFHWTALGHYHAHSILKGDLGQPIAAYSGSILAGGLDEPGSKGCLIVTLGDGPARVEPVILDARQVRSVQCDLTGSPHGDDARSRAANALSRADAGPDDLVHLSLTGRLLPGLDLSFLEELSERYFHLRVDPSALEPDIDLDSYPPLSEATTTEQRFVARMRSELEEGTDPVLTRRALLYGLDALTRGRIETKYEE